MSIMHNWTIYKITSPSNKIYVGITTRFTKRMNYYKNNHCSGQKRLAASFKKYGYENHKVEIIEEFKGEENYALSKEMFWIRTYMVNFCKWPEYNGLNLTDGGQGTVGYKATDAHRKRLSEIHKRNPSRGMAGKKVSEETKQKIKEAREKNRIIKPIKRKPTKEETRLKMSLAKIGKPAHNKGKPMPLHQLELLRKINTGRPSPKKGKKFEGSKEERKIKFGTQNIGNTYNKGRKHSQDIIEARIKLQNKPINKYTIDGCFIKEYPSIKIAHQELKMSATTIGNILRGVTKTPKRFIFKYK